jgi:adenylate cyclase
VQTESDLELGGLLAGALSAGVSAKAMSEVDRVIARGIAQIVAACRRAVLQTTLRPRMTELEAAQVWAQDSERLLPIATRRIALAFEALFATESNACASALPKIGAGKIAGARAVSVALRRHRRVHATRRDPLPGGPRRGCTTRGGGIPSRDSADDYGQDDRRRRHAHQPRSRTPTSDDLTLLDEVSKLKDFPGIRAGLAHGEAHERAGDWYGETVNLASRITQAGPPATVIATDSIRKPAPGEFCWTPFVAGDLKGIHRRPRLYSIARVQQ